MHWLVRLRLAWRQITTGFPSRARLAARDALATALACLLAWLLAVWLLGHEHPTFAIVSAVVCLAPGVPSHLKQARNLVIGCTFGIVMGELMWQLPRYSSTGADEHWYVLRYFVGRRHRPGSGGPHPGWSIGGSGSCHGA
ncbi:FUSC family protein [Klebsiella variicola subsp. variicola]|nr:FUSC family protein [Klebsiella variicola subsp. variicola]